MRRGIVSAVVAAMLVVAGVGGASAQNDDERTHSTEHFSITWTDDGSSADAPDLTDDDSDGVPDAVEEVAAAFEVARAFVLDLGYREPPVEGRYPLYVARADGTGYTRSSPGGTGRSKPSFIFVPSRLVQSSTSSDVLRTFAVHEYFHAVQIGYDSGEAHWIKEATSTWIEDLFVDDADSAHYLVRYFVPFRRLSLDTIDGRHEYGAFLFFQFVTERYGGGSVAGARLVREMWEEMAVPEALPGAPDRTALDAIAAVLGRRGVEMADAWGEFLVWRRRLGKFEEGSSYRNRLDGSGWRVPLRADRVRSESCRLTTDTEDGGGLPHLSGDYVRLRPHRKTPLRTTARLVVEGPAHSTGFALVNSKGSPVEEHRLGFDDDGIAALEVPFGRADVRALTLALGNAAPGGEPATLGYSLVLADRARVRAGAPSGPATVSFGTSARLSGTMLCRRSPAPLADVVITETERESGAVRRFFTETDASGVWRMGVDPAATALYSVEVIDPLYSGAASDATLLGVRVVVTLTVEPDRARLGDRVAVSGAVTPAHPGAPVTIEFRRPERAWRLGAETVVDATGSYAADLVLPADGIWEIRARVPSTGDADHLPGTSGGRLVRVD